MLTRDQILRAQDTQTTDVVVPEWGGTVRVRMMTGRERDTFERNQYELAKTGNLGDNMRARLVAICAIDEHGARLFEDVDVEKLGDKSGGALERVARACRNLNKIDEDAEPAVKNSEPSPAESST